MTRETEPAMPKREFSRLLNASFDAIVLLNHFHGTNQAHGVLSILAATAYSFPESHPEILYVCKTMIENRITDIPKPLIKYKPHYQSIISDIPDITYTTGLTIPPFDTP